MSLHPTAVIDRHAELDSGVEVGAYAIIERGVQIAAGTRIWPHAHISEGARIGRDCRIHPFAVVSHLPQDTKFAGGASYCRVGDGTIIREHATLHRGTEAESETVVGRNCFIMAGAHVGHNCVVGHSVTIVNAALLAGRVVVGDRAFIGGAAAIHQFTRIGELAMVGGCIRVITDVPPFMMAGPHGLAGCNVVGIRRAGLSDAERLELRRCYRELFRSGRMFREALDAVEPTVTTEHGRRLMRFLREPSKRGICGAARRHAVTEGTADE